MVYNVLPGWFSHFRRDCKGNLGISIGRVENLRMNESVFPKHSISRDEIEWEDYLAELTPWQNRQGVWFKRDDYFAPLGYGGPNGSKMRQLIWYVNRFRVGKNHIVTGASIQSPQLSMSAIVGAHYGLPSRQVVYSKPDCIET